MEKRGTYSGYLMLYNRSRVKNLNSLSIGERLEASFSFVPYETGP